MTVKSFEYELRVCSAYLRLCINNKSGIGFEKFSTQMRELIGEALEGGRAKFSCKLSSFSANARSRIL